MTLRKYGTGTIVGVEQTETAEKIQATASGQAWSEADEQGLQEETGE